MVLGWRFSSKIPDSTARFSVPGMVSFLLTKVEIQLVGYSHGVCAATAPLELPAMLVLVFQAVIPG